MIIYADLVFVANFISSLLLVVIYTVVFNAKLRLGRGIISAVISGAYAIIEPVFGLIYIIRIAVLVLMVFIAFGKREIIYNSIRFVFISVCVEGIFILIMCIAGKDAYMAGGTITVFANDAISIFAYGISFPIMCVVKKLLSRRLRLRKVCFYLCGISFNVTLLYDSGNLLIHKGVPVAVVSYSAICSALEAYDYYTLTEEADDRMIFNTVGTGGVMPVLTPEKSVIDGRELDIKIAVINKEFTGYDGVIGI